MLSANGIERSARVLILASGGFPALKADRWRLKAICCAQRFGEQVRMRSRGYATAEVLQ